MSSEMNVPQLRFSEFSGEWEDHKFKDLTKLQRGSSPRPIVKFVTKSEDGVNWIKIGDTDSEDIYINSTKDKITKEGAKKSRKVHVGDIILSNSMSYGKPFILNIDGYIHDGWFVIKDYEKNLNKMYLCQLLGSELVQKQYKRLAAGGVVSNISSELVNAVKINLPSKKEQEKIASFLSAVDIKIENLTKKEKLLFKYKKGVMQKIFSQDTRFKDIDGNNYPEWENTSMNKILEERKTYSTKGEDYQHISLTKEGVVPKTERYERDFLVSDDSVKKYKITHLHDICYNPANLKFGVICRNKFGSGIFSPIYITFEVQNADVKFVEYFVTRTDFINMVRKYEEGTVYERQAVKPSDFLKFSILMPTIKEQTKIANFLSSIDKKIESVSQQLNQTKEFKKALLQQMFV